MKYVLLVVEGAHEAALFGRILGKVNYSRIKKIDQVNPFWKRLIPTRFPPSDGSRLDHVIRFPDTYESVDGSNSIGVLNAGGDSRLVSEMRAALEKIGSDKFSSIGIFIDADKTESADERFEYISKQLKIVNDESSRDFVSGFPLSIPKKMGEISNGDPRIGVYVLPNNREAGSLENIVISCSKISYPKLYERSFDLISNINSENCDVSDLKSLNKPCGKEKAVVGVIANILEPGSSLSVSLENGRWIDGESGNVPDLMSVKNFIYNISNIPRVDFDNAENVA